MEVDAPAEGQPEEPEELDPLREALDSADSLADMTPDAATEAYLRIVTESERTDDVALRVKEQALYSLTKLYVKERQFEQVMGLLQSANPLFAIIPKVRHAPPSCRIPGSPYSDTGTRADD